MSLKPRALDLSVSAGAAYAGKLLAEVGWDVVKYESAAGDPLRTQISRWGGGTGGAFSFVNLGKRSVTVDEGTLRQLAAAADVVVGDFSASSLEAASLPGNFYSELEPRFVVTSVSAFGLTGPKADWASTELIVQAASGLMFLTGEHDQPPMQLAPYQGALTGGLAGAAATLAAIRSARHDGIVRRLDVSLVEALSSNIYPQLSAYAYRGEVARREARIKGGLRMVPASDGFVYCAPGAVATMRMDGIAILLDEPRLAEPRFQTAEGRMENYDEFLALFVPPFRNKTAQEWFDAAEALHMTFALVQTVDDLFACPQLDAREFLCESRSSQNTALRLPGRPYRTNSEATPPQRTAPSEPGVDTTEVLAEWLGHR
jgi:formyl-CoA transferase